MTEFTEAVAKRTGRKQRIPVAWLDHPVIGEGFRQTPRNSARKAAAQKGKATKPKATAAGTNDAPVTGDKE